MLCVTTHALLKEDKIAALKQHRICTILDFLRSENRMLERYSGFTYSEVVEVKKYLAKNASALPLNGLKYYQKIMTSSVLLSTGIPRLDDLIDGGLITGNIYELCGSAESHKLEIVLSIIVNVLSAGHGAYFLDTKNDFSVIKLKKKLDKKEDNQEKIINMLSKILVKLIPSKDKLISTLFDIKQELEKGLDVKLIVIHSISVLILNSNDTVENNHLLNHLANTLRYIAIELNVIIIVTNLMITWNEWMLEGNENMVEKVCCGKYWKGIPNVRLKISEGVDDKLEFNLLKNNNNTSNKH